MDLLDLVIKGFSLFDINLYEIIISFIKSIMSLIMG